MQLAMTIERRPSAAPGHLRIVAALAQWDTQQRYPIYEATEYQDVMNLECEISYRKGDTLPITCSGFYFLPVERIRPYRVDIMRKTFLRIDRGLTRISSAVPITDGVAHILAVASTLRVTAFLVNPATGTGWEAIDGAHAANALMRHWIRKADNFTPEGSASTSTQQKGQ